MNALRHWQQSKKIKKHKVKEIISYIVLKYITSFTSLFYGEKKFIPWIKLCLISQNHELSQVHLPFFKN